MAEALTTRSDWLRSHPPAGEELTETLAGVARRSMAGEGFRHAVREFLDEFALRGDDRSRSEAIAERPPETGEPRYDAYLGVLPTDVVNAADRRPAPE